MKNRGFLLIIIVSFVLQSSFFPTLLAERYQEFSNGWTFLIGVPPMTDYRIFMFWFLSFVSISFYFSGSVKENLTGYGQYMLVRNYSRIKWLMVHYFRVALILLGFFLLQSTVSNFMAIFSQGDTKHVVSPLLLKTSLIFYLTLLFVFILQLLLELYFNPQIAFLVVNTYVVGTILVADLFFKYKIKSFFLYLLLPNYAMGSRMDILSNDSNAIETIPAFITVIILLGLIFLLSIKKIKKMDIM
jgi:hypothetical protein